jgi:hypothetical protein
MGMVDTRLSTCLEEGGSEEEVGMEEEEGGGLMDLARAIDCLGSSAAR